MAALRYDDKLADSRGADGDQVFTGLCHRRLEIRKEGDAALIREAAIPLDRALFPLLVLIERLGPIGIVELADRVGRDHTTVSRQVAKLESLELAARQVDSADRRMRRAVITPWGKAMTDAVDAARDRLGSAILGGWPIEDIDDILRLMRKFADALQAGPQGGG